MIVYHVAILAADDYLTRRDKHRGAHIERIQQLRASGLVIAGGPSADGKTADIFYRVAEPAQLETLVEEDPYWLGGVWTRYTPRSFCGFVEPWEAPPVVLDGSRRVTVVEGRTIDPAMAEFSMIEMRGSGRIAFGGFFEDGSSLVLARTTDADEARRWFAETGFWDAARVTTRPLLHVL